MRSRKTGIAESLEGLLTRVRGYRGAAQTLRQLKQPAHQILEAEEVAGLIKLPSLGRSLANAINHLVWSHRLPLLERLRGENAPEQMLATVPNIGKELAHRIHDHLGTGGCCP